VYKDKQRYPSPRCSNKCNLLKTCACA